MAADPIVHVIDDDEAVRQSLEFLLRSSGIAARTYNSAAAFLAEPPFLGRRPVFVGDDTTDEDGFAEIRGRGGAAVRVGPFDNATAADYRLPTVEAVLAWLASGGLG
jgi:trehalose-6-phosphatase